MSLYGADKVLPVVRYCNYAVVGRLHGDMNHTYNKVRHGYSSIIGTLVDFSGAVLLDCSVDLLLNQYFE